MGTEVQVWPEGLSEHAGRVRAQAAIEIPGRERFVLWFDVPQAHAGLLGDTCDPFLLALFFTAMRRGVGMRVHGTVSPSLLRNLGDLQVVWNAWCPRHYTPVELAADAEEEPPWAAEPRGTVVGFSGGVDSSFTVWRHRTGRAVRRVRDIHAAMMVHGFDIPLEREEDFAGAAAKAKVMLDSVGLPLLTVATNLRALRQRWPDSWAVSLVACLALFQKAYSTALVADEFAADWHGPTPSGPLTEGLMSCNALRVLSDGALFTRTDKLRELAQWPEAMRHLRVCYAGERLDRNCGRCRKCTRTILAFRALGLPLPECFERDVTTRDILRLRRLPEESVYLTEQVLALARHTAPGAGWVRALGYAVLRSRLRLARKAAFRELRRLASDAFALVRPRRASRRPARDPGESSGES
ncbi:MAG TPA: hypothetical protein VNE39_23910 [Planctomycetota bacterium]|nr:hypothetical protein [Planctomycetota bacterium]